MTLLKDYFVSSNRLHSKCIPVHSYRGVEMSRVQYKLTGSDVTDTEGLVTKRFILAICNDGLGKWRL